MTRPAGAQNVTGRVGSGRVGSGQAVFKILRVGSGPVKRISNLAGRVRSGQVGSRGDEKLTGRVRS